MYFPPKPSTVGSSWAPSITRNRLPKLHPISFRIDEPAKLSEIVAVAFRIDRDAFRDQPVQNSIQVIHLKVDHYLLCRRKVRVLLFEESEHNLRALLRRRKLEPSHG